MSAILSVKNLTVSFGDKKVIEDLSFELKPGENLTVIGPNGSGKTVLLKALLGAIHYHGEIIWAKGMRVGYVPQKIEADLHLPLTTDDLLAAKARVMNLKRNAIEAVSKATDLSPDVLKTPIGHLSGGQFQKALIAFALLGEPNIILFDEPTASLDLPREEQIYELIHRLQEKYGLTIILVSHDLSLVYRYASKVLCLNQRGLCFGTPSEVLTLKVLQELYGRERKYYKHEH